VLQCVLQRVLQCVLQLTKVCVAGLVLVSIFFYVLTWGAHYKLRLLLSCEIDATAAEVSLLQRVLQSVVVSQSCNVLYLIDVKAAEISFSLSLLRWMLRCVAELQCVLQRVA